MKDINLKDSGSPEKRDEFQQIDLHGDIFRQIFKFSIIPTIVHDMEMNIIDANDSALEKFGYSQTEILGKKIFELHTEDQIAHSNKVLKKMSKEDKLSADTSFKRKDGSVFFAKVSPCKYLLGEKPIIHVFIQDITQRILAEKKLKEANEALKVEMARAERNNRLIEMKNRELEEFSHIAAHDLKAPVVNIEALKNMIDTGSFNDPQSKKIFERLMKNIDHLRETVFSLNDVINFKTTLKNKKELLNFKSVFKDVKDSINQQLISSKASIIEDFSECPEINYPPQHLISILQNLLTNAIKYKKPDEPLKIEIKTTIQQGKIRLTMKDNGLGFDSSESTDKVFGLFKRLHTHVEGKGVGMYIVKSILEAHGGKIEVESKPNEGALFTVYFF